MKEGIDGETTIINESYQRQHIKINEGFEVVFENSKNELKSNDKNKLHIKCSI
jgi:hypothetical protein